MNGQEQETYEFDEFRLDLAAGVLLREGEPVCLQWKTFETLCALVRSKGRLVTLDELMNVLWNDAFVEENNLRQHISALRKALGEKEKQTIFIETVPRRGYRFLPEVRIGGSDKRKILPPNNLSIQPAALIGREKEIAEILHLLRREDVRILTLTGVGGTGKTTLAQAAAREILADFKDGTFFVEFAAVTNPELVASTIAQTLGLKETGGKAILEVLKEYLRGKRMLLVIDNFEQLSAASAILTELVMTSTNLKILATSRILLNLSLEYEFVVPALSMPIEAAPVSPADLLNYEAVRLFVERVRKVKPLFALTEENAQSVAEICARLDGLPLAIELAAARLKILSPLMILTKLENRLNLLTGGGRDLPLRQQTMRGTIEWSYELLTEDEKTLFRQLAVFAGGFTLPAAEALSGERSATGGNEPLIKETGNKNHSPFTVLDGISQLVNNSLLVQREQANGETRFRMLAVVREYALDALESSGEAKTMLRRQADYFLDFGEKIEPHFQSAESAFWLDRMEEEHDNFRAAIEWLSENDLETAARLAAVMRFLWIDHNHLTEGRRWLETVLSKARDIPLPVQFKLLNGLGVVTRYQGDYAASNDAYQKGLAAGKKAGDRRQIALANRGLGAVAHHRGDFTAAREFIKEGLTISRETDDQPGIAFSLNCLGNLARATGEMSEARPFFEESLAIFRQLGNEQLVLNSLINLGSIALGDGDYKKARAHFGECLSTAERFGDKISISYSLDGFAAIAVNGGEWEKAGQLAGVAESLRDSVGFEMDISDQNFREAYLAKLRAEVSEADFTDLYEHGWRLRLEEAVKLALEE